MLFLATEISQTPWIKVLGTFYLVWLAFDNLSTEKKEDAEEEAIAQQAKQKGFWSIVLTVEISDFVFSLDNVVAAGSLSNKIWVVMVGVAIGILVMRFAAGIFSYVVEKEPILKTAAYILVLNIGVELLLEDLAHVEISDWMRFAISMGTIALTLAYAHLKFLRVFRPVLIWISQGLALVNGILTWVLAPLTGLLGLLRRIIQRQPPGAAAQLD